MMVYLITIAMCEDYDARIIIGSEEAYYSDQNQHPMNYYIEGELAVGRIELCESGRWSPICQDNWNEKDASVACFQLGFSRAGDTECNLCYTCHVIFMNS